MKYGNTYSAGIKNFLIVLYILKFCRIFFFAD